MSVKYGNMYGLFGIGFYFIGLLMAKYKQWIYLPIPIVFCLWYWFTYGFGLRDYVFIYFSCMMVAIFLQQGFTTLKSYFNMVLPEKLQNIAYDEKLTEMNDQIALYKKNNPQEKITQEIIEQIRTEIFFRK